MGYSLRQFVAGFLLTAILVGTLCGFMLVDMSTERYMPGRFGPLLLITSVDSEGVAFSFLGEDYILSADPAGKATGFLEQYHGLLPLHMQVAQAVGGQLHAVAAEEEQETLSHYLLWSEEAYA